MWLYGLEASAAWGAGNLAFSLPLASREREGDEMVALEFALPRSFDLVSFPVAVWAIAAAARADWPVLQRGGQFPVDSRTSRL